MNRHSLHVYHFHESLELTMMNGHGACSTLHWCGDGGDLDDVHYKN